MGYSAGTRYLLGESRASHGREISYPNDSVNRIVGGVATEPEEHGSVWVTRDYPRPRPPQFALRARA